MTKILLKNSRQSVIPVVLLMLLFAVSGCSKKEAAAPSPATSPKNEPAKHSPTPPVQKQLSSVSKVPSVVQFDFSTKKDPFKPYIAPTIAAPVASNPAKHLLPIHKFDVNQFRVIGIVTGGKENQAMVVDPNGKGYVVKAGMTIGKSEARVTAINNKGIEILEQYRDDNGRVHKQRLTITLPRKE